MKKCIICGKENEAWLCADCAPSQNEERLCQDFCLYRIGSHGNELWDSFEDFLTDDIAFSIIDELCVGKSEGLKTYYKVLYFAKNNCGVKKENRDFLLKNADGLLSDGELSPAQKSRIKGLLLDLYMSSHDYSSADKLAAELSGENELPKQAIYTLTVFFGRTRRYEKAEKTALDFIDKNSADPFCNTVNKEYENIKSRHNGTLKEYIPKSNEDAEKYFSFLDSLDIAYEKPRRIPKAIPVSEYPAPQTADGTVYNDFVAFDVETTGKDSKKDSIIELAAVKVRNGKIVDTFSELVRPIDKKLSEKITEITGITAKDLESAREIWEVFPDFLKFIEDDVLIGYNSVSFDSKFLVRAGRYSNIIIKNKHFDVMNYSLKFKRQLGIKKTVKLVQLGELLGIENPQAHRALADAETTAKIYLKLVKMPAD